jgi:hypothetical protein
LLCKKLFDVLLPAALAADHQVEEVALLLIRDYLAIVLNDDPL